MLVLAAFLAICAMGVAFLLRFLFALESDLRAQGKHPARVERIHTCRIPARSVAGSAAPALVLVHSNLGLAQPARRGTVASGVRVNAHSRVQQA
jgi:hypothetical protein